MKKIFSKYKQLSGYFKAFIIGVLVASCFGVYAAGTCIIAATADDVTYGNTTVQSAIDELYSMSHNYCPPGYECIKNNLYNKLAKDAVLDDRASTYVTSSNGIDFSQISSDTNGKGIYEIASTKDDDYPIYYYRGEVDNNNVKFGGFCWKAIRTTDTGGVKMIYNGEPDQDGYCTNTTGASTQIGSSKYNTNYSSISDVGYMYGTKYSSSKKDGSALATAYMYGNDVTYSNGTYTLIDTMTSSGDWSSDYSTLNNNHYTCFSNGTTCSSVYFIFQTGTTFANYITLTNGKKVEDALDEMFTNTTNSTAKTQVDNWYNSNLSSYTNYIEDTIYCNDRSISNLGGFNPDGGNTPNSSSFLYFSSDTRKDNYIPSLECSRMQDRFTVSSSKGNGALTYPVGLITSDEVMYAGGKTGTTNSNTTYYLYTNFAYWTISPNDYRGSYAYVNEMNRYGYFDETGVYFTNGLRPVISISPNSALESGSDGTATNPYVVQTN